VDIEGEGSIWNSRAGKKFRPTAGGDNPTFCFVISSGGSVHDPPGGFFHRRKRNRGTGIRFMQMNAARCSAMAGWREAVFGLEAYLLIQLISSSWWLAARVSDVLRAASV